MGMAYALKDLPGIVALTVDHKLRQESTEEALQVQQWMQKWGIPHVILTWEHDGISTDLQNKAREARYQLMTDWCHHHDVRVLMTAHHLEDQVETFLMRLMKGSGLKGLCAMQECVDYNGITIMRPFLQVRKSALHANVEHWINDPSNDNLQFERVRVRKLAEMYLNLDPQLNIVKSLAKLKEADKYLDEMVAQHSSDIVGAMSLSSFIIFERFMNKHFSKTGYPFKRKALQQFYDKLCTPDFKVTTFASHIFRKNKDGEIVWELEKMRKA